MKNRASYLFIALSITLLSACGGKKESTEEVTQLTYREFYELMFEDFENRVEWHEDDFNQEGQASITITKREQCENGEKVFVKNISSDQTIRVVIKTAFSIPNTVPYFSSQFMMVPGDEVHLGCTKFSFNEETFDLDHQVVVAEYIEDRE